MSSAQPTMVMPLSIKPIAINTGGEDKLLLTPNVSDTPVNRTGFAGDRLV
ncbi:hypothetical protein [Asticcacaulis tiandongensis]|nr:hypothetical protein [Asticcacaulis tiandongensis]